MAQARDGGALVDRRLGAHGSRDRAAHDRLGDHLAVHASSGASCDGCKSRAGGRRPREIPARLRDVEDLPQQHPLADVEDARADARRGDDRPRRPRGRAVLVRRRYLERRRAGPERRRRHAARRSARLRGGDGAEDAGARGRDLRRVSDTVDHDACLRPLHARERRRGHRHRLHRGRVDPRDRP